MHPKRLEGRISRAMHRACLDFSLIDPDDRILVALSGGKDSYGLLWGLQKMAAAAPFDLELVAFHLDQAQPGQRYVGSLYGLMKRRTATEHEHHQTKAYRPDPTKTSPA